MYFLRLYRDQGDGGGGSADGGGAGGTGDPTGGGGSGDAGGGAGGAGDKAGGGGSAGGGAGTGKAGGTGGAEDKDFDFKVGYEKLKAEHEAVQAKVIELQKGNDKLGQKLGALKKFEQAWEEDPEKLIERIAKEHKPNIKFEGDTGKKPQLPNKMPETIEELHEILNSYGSAISDKVRKDVMGEVGGELKLTYENRMRDTYKDYDEHADARKSLRLQHISGAISMDEILHNAVRGMKLPEILKGHEKDVRAKVYKELAEKTGGSHSGGGGSTGGGQQGSGSEIDLSKPQDIKYLQERKNRAKV